MKQIENHLAHRAIEIRRELERGIRSQCSEFIVWELHDRVYKPVKRAAELMDGAVNEGIRALIGMGPVPSARDQRGQLLARLRSLLEQGVKEHELQRVLHRLLNLDCTAVSEVVMQPTDDCRRMRMDLIVDPTNEVIELKRGLHLLLAHRGKPAERISAKLRDAVAQVRGYGRRLKSEPDVSTQISKRHGVELREPSLRLVAGRRLSTADEYQLLHRLETDSSDAGQGLLIYTWDGFVAELERILD